MNDIKLDNDVKNIIKIYRLISFWYVRFGVLFVIVIIGIVILYLLSRYQDSVFSFDETNVNQTKFYSELPGELVGERIMYFTDKTFTGLNVEILFGNIFMNINDTIISNNNIVNYGDYYFPNYFELTKLQKNKFINYFSGDIKGEIDLRYLYEYLKIISVDTENKNIQSIKPPSKLKSLNGTFLEKFGLRCMIKGFGNSHFCSKNIDYFLNNFYRYQIIEDLESLEKINDVIQKSKYKNKYCDGLLNYMYKTSNVNIDEVGGYLAQCGNDYQKVYNKLLWFKETLGDFGKGRISSNVYEDNSVNMYKLITGMSFVVDLNKGVDLSNIQGFLDYVTNLLIERKIKNHVYYDLLYIFINDPLYLKKSIKLAQGKSDDQLIIEINKKISNININLGLETLVTNKKLVKLFEKKTVEKKVSKITVKSLFDNYISEFKKFRIYGDIKEDDIKKEITVGESSVIMSVSKGSGKKEEVDIMINKMVFKLDLNNRFTIIKVNFENKELNDHIMGIINKKEDITFPELMELVEYFGAIEGDVEFDLCKVLNDQLRGVTLEDEKVNILLCNPKSVIALKFGGVLYRFYIKNNTFDNFTISDNDIYENLKQNNNKTILIEQLPQFIYDIVSYRIEKDTIDIDLSDARTIKSKFDMYLGAEVIDTEKIAGEEGLYKVIFNIDSNIFSGELDFKNSYSLHKIFYHIEEGYDEIEISLGTIRFRLTESDVSNLNYFSDRPMEYIERNEPNSYKKIIDYIENNK